MRSLLTGLPNSSVMHNRRGHCAATTGYVAVVDGKQRIETLRAVADGLLPIPAVWVIPALIARAFNGATDSLAGRLHDPSLAAVVHSGRDITTLSYDLPGHWIVSTAWKPQRS